MNPVRLAAALAVLAPFLCAAAEVGPASPAVDLSRYSTVIYVDPVKGNDFSADGSQAKPWASFEGAFGHTAVPAVGQRTAILLSAGRYSQPTFAFKERVDIYGGYASPGGERDVFHHATVFDGGESRRIAIGTDDSRIDGIEFASGRVRGKGGALLCDGTSPEIVNCLFVENRTLKPAGWNPPHLHETANDGGAIACLNGGSPEILSSLFYSNATECGRGGAIACDRRANPRIEGCVFANNRAGLDDPMRSSDGGAISAFNFSSPLIKNNVVVANESLAANDSGGLWTALWSSPDIDGNKIVGNSGADDAGGLFAGGQEHRYGEPLDPYPPADKFLIKIERNWFIGNRNGSENSGAMRITMESRALLRDNVIAENVGGMYLQRSEVTAESNTVWQQWMFLEDKPSLGPSRFVDDILAGPAGQVEARLSIEHCMTEPSVKGQGDLPVSDIFLEDGLKGGIARSLFDPVTFCTVLTLAQPLPPNGHYAGRPFLLGAGHAGQWRVIREASGTTLVYWGRQVATTKPIPAFEILRTFTPRADAPAHLGAHLAN